MSAGVEDDVKMVRMEVPDAPGVRETLSGLKDAVGPSVTAGATEAIRFTGPEKPRLLRLIVEAPEEPA